MKQRARWCGRKEDQGAAQAAGVVEAVSRVVGAASWGTKASGDCEERKAAWGQEKWEELSRTHQGTELPNTDVDVVDALFADGVMLFAAGEATLPNSRKA